MNTLQFQAGQRIKVQQAHSDLGITGWDRDTIELTLDGDLDQCTAKQQEGTLVIESDAALALHVPRHIAVHISDASGDMALRQLDGAVSIDTVHGDLSIHGGAAETTISRAHSSLTADHLAGTLFVKEADGDVHLSNTSAVRLGHLHGALYAHDVDGGLEMGVVDGDVRARAVTGPVRLEAGKSSFQGQSLHGGMSLNEISGDLLLKTDVTPGFTYHARARGTIDAHFAAGTSARFQLSASGLLSARLPRIEQQEPGRVVGTAGAAEAEVELHADGDLTVAVLGPQESNVDAWTTIDSISSQIEGEMARHLDEMNVDALAQREIDKAMRKAEQELARAQHFLEQEQRHAQERAARAQEQAARAQERAARAAQRAQAKIARKSHRWGIPGDAPSLFGPYPTPRGSQAEKQGPSSEEQLAVLVMLQEKKISVAEAEDLLAALDG